MYWYKKFFKRIKAILEESIFFFRSLAFNFAFKDNSFSEAALLFKNSRNLFYEYMYVYFIRLLPKELKIHRKYFKQYNRGFGEDALHSMWFILLREYRPKNLLEIGVYRGQIISLWALISKLCNFECKIHGISPFSSSGDGVSKYLNTINYLDDTLSSHKFFNLSYPKLITTFSTDKKAIKYIKSKKWDLIYIDGSHDFDIVLSDFNLSVLNLAKNGLLVIDDSSLFLTYKPPAFSFAGHPGPSKVVRDYALHNKKLKFLGAVGHNNVFIKK